MAEKMPARESVYGSLAECFVTIDGNRYNFMQMIDFESEYEIGNEEVPLLGQVNKGHKPGAGNGTWSGTAHYNQSIMRKLAHTYQKTGVFPYFDIQVTNEDPASSIGRQTVIHRGCLMDKVVLAKFDANETILEEDLSGTFESWEMPEEFRLIDGM